MCNDSRFFVSNAMSNLDNFIAWQRRKLAALQSGGGDIPGFPLSPVKFLALHTLQTSTLSSALCGDCFPSERSEGDLSSCAVAGKGLLPEVWLRQAEG